MNYSHTINRKANRLARLTRRSNKRLSSVTQIEIQTAAMEDILSKATKAMVTPTERDLRGLTEMRSLIGKNKKLISDYRKHSDELQKLIPDRTIGLRILIDGHDNPRKRNRLMQRYLPEPVIIQDAKPEVPKKKKRMVKKATLPQYVYRVSGTIETTGEKLILSQHKNASTCRASAKKLNGVAEQYKGGVWELMED